MCQKQRTKPKIVNCLSFTSKRQKEKKKNYIKKHLAGQREKHKQTNKQMQTLICLSAIATLDTPHQNVYLQCQPSLELENWINTL